jgi:hypothetical protein
MSKAYRLAPDYILYQMSYINVALYSSVLPSYDEKKKENEQDFDESKDANDPDNFTNDETEMVVKA